MDRAGNLVINERIGRRIRVVAVRTGTFYGQAMTAGDIYTVFGDGSGGHLAGMAVDRAGNLVFANIFDNRVWVLAESTGTFYGVSMTAGNIYPVAGGGKGRIEDGGPATKARLLKPEGVAIGPAGSLVIADTDNGLIRAVTG